MNAVNVWALDSAIPKPSFNHSRAGRFMCSVAFWLCMKNHPTIFRIAQSGHLRPGRPFYGGCKTWLSWWLEKTIQSQILGYQALHYRRQRSLSLDCFPSVISLRTAALLSGMSLSVVAPGGLEPPRPKARDFKSRASTGSATGPRARTRAFGTPPGGERKAYSAAPCIRSAARCRDCRRSTRMREYSSSRSR